MTSRPLVVHVVCSDGFAGVERYVVDTANELDATTWQVCVIGGNPAAMRAALRPEIRFLPGSTVAQVARSMRTLADPAIVHAHMTAAEMVAAVLRGRRRYRLIVTRHFAAVRGKTWLGAAGRPLISRSVDQQIAISEFVARRIDGDSQVIHNGVPRSAGDVAASYRRDKSVLVLQRLESEKDTATAIRAWAISELGACGWVLKICGRGHQEPMLKELARECGVLDSVQFLGFVDEPRASLSRAGLLLATAPEEPFGLSVVEAMAEGTPVLAADGGAHLETLGSDGRYFAVGDAEDCARTLRALAEDADGRERYGLALRQRYEAGFTIQRHVDRLAARYSQLLDDAPTGSSKRVDVATLSLEHWDEVWRRNQHLASALIAGGHAKTLSFIEPPTRGLRVRAARRSPARGIEVITPPLIIPRRFGGHAVLGTWIRWETRRARRLWINDPVAGRSALRKSRVKAVYDVTDDWREMPQRPAERTRTIASEDYLSSRAVTVVCSAVLRDRWRERYGVDAPVIENAVDTSALERASPLTLSGVGPHAVYVGTLHSNRLDVELVVSLANQWAGTVHLVGPDYLSPHDRSALTQAGVRLEGPVSREQVPAWLISADVLICPHLIDSFTLSLNAIKSHEYLATDKPVVSTASSGFQSLVADGLAVTPSTEFVRAVMTAPIGTSFVREPTADWTAVARRFAEILQKADD